MSRYVGVVDGEAVCRSPLEDAARRFVHAYVLAAGGEFPEGTEVDVFVGGDDDAALVVWEARWLVGRDDLGNRRVLPLVEAGAGVAG